MKSRITWFIAVGLLGLIVLIAAAQTGRDVSGALKHKPGFITRLYTCQDGQTHVEEIEAKFTFGATNDAFKMMGISGAELHRAPAGRVSDWHTAPGRQYVITLSARRELEVSGEKRSLWNLGTSSLSKIRPGRVTSRESLARRIG